MATKRLKISGRNAVYHCMNRMIHGMALFSEKEKEMFRKMLWKVAKFSGVDVLTYAVMDNHFHILVHVPEKKEVDDQTLVERYAALFPAHTHHDHAMDASELEKLLARGGEDAENMREQLLKRMGDVSEFMKTLKQRYTMWYNAHHDCYGTLWAQCFRSVLVENNSQTLRVVAAYIDLNAVRAGLVEDPKDYRFCGYAEALANHIEATAGLRHVMTDQKSPIRKVLATYRCLLYGRGSKPSKDPKKQSITEDKVAQVRDAERGELSLAELLRHRVDYFTKGIIIGSKSFIDLHAEQVKNERRRKLIPRAKKMRGGDWGKDLNVLKDLRFPIHE